MNTTRFAAQIHESAAVNTMLSAPKRMLDAWWQAQSRAAFRF